jgi:hypothetical protein
MQYSPCALRSWTNLPIFFKFFHLFEKNHVKFMGSSSNVQFPYMHFLGN